MNWKKLLYQRAAIALAIAPLLVSLSSAFTATQAQPNNAQTSSLRFNPPSLSLAGRGAPGGRRGGATRGQCPKLEAGQSPLTALVPDTQKLVLGLTVSENPTLWFYIPYALSERLPLKFVLQDEQKKEVYQTTFAGLQTQPGIVKLTLPSTVTLETGKMYNWKFAIYCDPNISGESPKISVQGWIQRTAPNATLASQLKESTPRQLVALYAKEGIWFDALTTLAELQMANPQDVSLKNDWVSLLESVGLSDIAQAPIIQCCIPR